MIGFKVGEKVIYPNHGLGVIEAIRDETFNGEQFQVFHLRIIANNTLVLVPSSAVAEIGIRSPLPEAAIKKIFQFLRNGSVDVIMNWKGRYKEHVNLMRSGTLLDMALVLKSLYYLSLLKPLSFREKKMLEKAKELIVSEISETTAETPDRVEHKVLDTLSRCFKDVKARANV